MNNFLLQLSPFQLSWREPLWLLLLLAPVALFAAGRVRHHKLAAYADAHLMPWAVAAQGDGAFFSKRAAMSWIAWLLLSIAAAGPRLPLVQAASPVQQAESTHALTLMVALDVSASMTAADIAPNRLARARLELSDLIKRLHG
jgi:Ca-activated chloride channel family protein